MMQELVCPHCGHQNRNDNRFCTQCGVRLGIPDTVDSPRLVMLHGDRPKTVFSLNGIHSTIGREECNSIVLNDTQISKHHATIMQEDGRYWIEDCNSKNGVFINGKKIRKKEELVHGCLLKFGSTILRFEQSPVPEDIG